MERDIERLQETLSRLSQAMRYPETPAIAPEVERRIMERRSPRLAPAWALAAVAVTVIAVLLAAVAASVSPVRDAVADVFDRINIFEDEAVPPGASTTIEGSPVTLTDAEALAGIDLLLPKGETPKEVLFQDFGAVTAAALFFEDPDVGDYWLFESDAGVDKHLSPEADWESVGGFEGGAYWLTGMRLVQYREPGGGTIEESARVTDINTLVWEEGSAILRLEGNLTQLQAVEIARSLR